MGELGESSKARVPAGPHSFDEHSIGVLRRVGHPLGFAGVEPERLLAQHVLASLQRPDRPFEMLVIREADVDGIYRWILDELAVGGVDDVGRECS